MLIDDGISYSVTVDRHETEIELKMAETVQLSGFVERTVEGEVTKTLEDDSYAIVK